MGTEGTKNDQHSDTTCLETLDGRIVTIPNSVITDNSVLNISMERGRRIKFHIGLANDTSVENMELTKEILIRIVEENEHTIDPVAAFEVLDDFSLNIVFIYWIKKGSPIILTQDAINMQLLKQFNKAGLKFSV